MMVIKQLLAINNACNWVPGFTTKNREILFIMNSMRTRRDVITRYMLLGKNWIIP